MDQYLADRFPRAFTAFLKEEARRRSSLPIDLYVHDHPVAEAYQFHQRDGYDYFLFSSNPARPTPSRHLPRGKIAAPRLSSGPNQCSG